MSKLTFWVIEDDPMSCTEIIKALARVQEQSPHDFDILTGNNWEWPPRLGKVGEVEAKVVNVRSPKSLPDILILDLFGDEGNFQGGAFYRQLREQEAELRKREAVIEKRHPGALVIIRSGYWERPESKNFVERMKIEDSRFVLLPSKAEPVLLKALNRCIRRIEEGA
ncbi:MAG: hypothetical protein ACRD2L_17075 [Terriglobia bacterium]